MPRKKRKIGEDRPGLDRKTIVAAALAEIDEKGVAALTLRGLASRLGVYPTAIYWHVPTKDDLHAEIAAALFRGVAVPRDERPWKDYLRLLFYRYRSAMAAHPGAAPLVGAHLVGNRSIDFAFVEAILGTLADAGLKGKALVYGYNGIIAALIGFVVQEFSPVPEDDDGLWERAVRERVEGVDADSYPVLAANRDLLANKAFILRWQNGRDAPLDDSFESFVAHIIRSVEAMADRPDP